MGDERKKGRLPLAAARILAALALCIVPAAAVACLSFLPQGAASLHLPPFALSDTALFALRVCAA